MIVEVHVRVHWLLDGLDIGLHLGMHTWDKSVLLIVGRLVAVFKVNRTILLSLLSNIKILVLRCARETTEPSTFFLWLLLLLLLVLNILLLPDRFQLIIFLQLAELLFFHGVVIGWHALLLSRHLLLIDSVYHWISVSLHFVFNKPISKIY